jgi:hypothetical protein
MADALTMTRTVPLSRARRSTWLVVGVACALAVWHGYGITVAPQRPFFWIGTGFDVLVACVALVLGRGWPEQAVFGPDELVLGKVRTPYASITDMRRGEVSAKPFWLAFWLPTSLLIGLVVVIFRSEEFNREVVEFGTGHGRARCRWRDSRSSERFLSLLREVRPDLEVQSGVGPHVLAKDYTPRLGAGGGFLAFGMVLWLFLGGWFGIQLFDQSLYRGPYPVDATSAAVRTLTGRLAGVASQPGGPVEFTEWACDRTNDLVLGPAPDVVDLHLKLVDSGMPLGSADAVEARLRRSAGMDPGQYLQSLDDQGTDVEVDIPEDPALNVEVSTGCVDSGGVPRLRDDLTKFAAAFYG